MNLFWQAKTNTKKSLSSLDKNKMIETYRERFKYSLIGTWTSDEGTFQMMQDTFVFYEDGKGVWTSLSGGDKHQIGFYWKPKSIRTIEMRETKQDHWVEIKYDFKVIRHDIGETIILCEEGSDTFYWAVTRVTFVNIL